MVWNDTAQNFRPVSNIRASMNYFHPEVQEIWPFKNLKGHNTLTNANIDNDVNTDAKVVVTAIALPVLLYRLAKNGELETIMSIINFVN